MLLIGVLLLSWFQVPISPSDRQKISQEFRSIQTITSCLDDIDIAISFLRASKAGDDQEIQEQGKSSFKNKANHKNLFDFMSRTLRMDRVTQSFGAEVFSFTFYFVCTYL